MDNHVWYIKSCRLFERLSVEQLAQLERHARIRRYAKGATVHLPSDAGNAVFLLAEGRVKLCSTTPDGKQAILAFIDPGELFGELAHLEQSQREEHAETMTASTLVLLPAGAIEHLMNESPALTERRKKVPAEPSEVNRRSRRNAGARMHASAVSRDMLSRRSGPASTWQW
jgi:CRP-like cAMP-binding protein